MDFLERIPEMEVEANVLSPETHGEMQQQF
jgi:hypothetical protein